MLAWGRVVAAAGPQGDLAEFEVARNSSHSVAVSSRYSSLGRSVLRWAMKAR